jgi:hypothetical protein
MSYYEQDSKTTIPIIVAIIDEKNFPWIIYCTATMEPSYVLRRGEQQIIVRTHFDKANDKCWREGCCLNQFCCYSKTEKSYVDRRLSKLEQEFLEKHRFEIADQCREAYAKSSQETIRIVEIDLKEKPPGA